MDSDKIIGLSFCVAFLLMLSSYSLTCPFAEEKVDVSNLNYAYVTLTYSFPGSYINSIRQEILEAKCRTLTSATSCVPVIQKKTNNVIFKVFESSRIDISNLQMSGNEVVMNLSLEYTPKLNSLLQGVKIGKKSLKFVFPKYSVVLENYNDRKIKSSFRMKFSETHDMEIPFENLVYTLGDAIRIPSISDHLRHKKSCMAVISQGKTVVATEMQMDCDAFSISTSGIPSGGDYALTMFAVERDQLFKKSVKITLEEPQLKITAIANKKKINLGDIFQLDVSSSQKLTKCTVSIEDNYLNPVETLRFHKCESLPIGTNTEWTPGTHTIRVTGHAGELKGITTINIDFVNVGFSKSKVGLEKTDFIAGEKVTVYPRATSEYCYVELLDSNYIRVDEYDSPGCETIDLGLDQALKPGNYVIKTTAYDGARVVSRAAKSIEIKAWSADYTSFMTKICDDGFLTLKTDDKLPCIVDEDYCKPPSDAIPLCVCFNKKESPVQICKYGEQCKENGCISDPLFSPFVISSSQDSCIARRGIEKMNCVHLGEIAAGEAVCLDNLNRPLTMCSPGEICTEGGCIESRFEFDILTREPKHVRQEKLQSGLKVILKGTMKFKGEKGIQILRNDHKPELRGRATLGSLKTEKIFFAYDNAKELWTVTVDINGFLPPSKETLLLEVFFRNDTHAIRMPLEIWYPTSNQQFSASIQKISPSRISFKEISKGAAIRVFADIKDQRGEIVKFLPEDAFDVSVENIKSTSTFAKFNTISQLWEIGANFKDRTKRTKSSVTLKVDYLGRSGETSKAFELVEKKDLRVSIRRVTPGSDNDPLFYLLVTVGFAMDVFISVDGETQIVKENIQVNMGGYDLTPNIDFIEYTQDGIRVHISDAVLCPNTPQPDSKLTLSVTIKDETSTVTDSTILNLVGNPGDWNNREQWGC